MRTIRQALRCGTALALCVCAAGPIRAQATLPVVAASGTGGATITSDATAGTMTIDIAGANRVVKYDSFKLGSPTSSSETLTFLNSGAAGTYSVLNRVTGGSGSAIYGSITAPNDIKVWLVDPQGVTFGPTGSFSGGGLVVSTATLNAADETSFLGGTLNALSGASTKPILFQTGSGTIAASGSIAVVGQQVTVDRKMTSTAGSVALVAATDVSFTDINSPLSFTVSRGTTLATGVSVGGNGVISGQSIRLAGGVNGAVTAALLQVDSGASITATASDGSIVLATGTTGGVTVANGSRTPGIDTAGALHADGASADIQITGAGQVNVAGTLSSGRDVTLSSADTTSGSVTAAGGVTAGRDYAVSAKGIVLGATAATVAQKAGRAITISTTGGDIKGKGDLTLQSNTDGAGAEALTLDPGSGQIAFDKTTSLIGGTSANQSDVILGGSAITTGDVTARALLRSGSTTDLTATGDITLGDVAVDAALRIASSGGSIQTGDLVSNGAVRLDAAAAGDIAAGTINAGGTADLLAKGDIRLASIEATGAITLTAQTGDISGAALSESSDDGRPLTGFGRADLTASGAGQTIDVTASGGTAQLGALAAGADADDLAANQITVSAKSVDLGSATATNGHVDLESASGPIHAGALSAGSDTAAADVIVNAPSGAVTIDGAVNATHDYRVNGASVTLGSSSGSTTQSADGLIAITATDGDITGRAGLSLQSGSDLTLDATGAATVAGAVSATGDYSVTGASVTLGNASTATTQSAGGVLTVTATDGDITGRAGLTLQSDSDVTLGATGAATVAGAVSATGDYSVTGASVTLGNASTATTQSAGGVLSATATGGDMKGLAGLTLQSDSDVTLDATGAATVAGAVSATGNYSVTGASVTLGNASTATTQSAGGVLSATATGGDITGLAGLSLQSDSDVTLDATGDATVAGAVSATGDYSVTGASVTLGNASTATTQSAGGVLTATATGGDMKGLAGLSLQSDSDVTIGATGSATVGGNVSAGGDYSVSGTSVTLGNTTSAATQSAGGLVSVTATDTDIEGLADLQLQSGKDGGGTGTLTLDAAGIVDFAGSSALLGGLATGPASDRADVLIGSAASLSLGDVTGRSLRTIDDATDLAATGAITTGDIAVDQALAIHTTDGAITTGDINVQGSGATLQLSAAGASSDLKTGDLHTNGADILLGAGRDVAVGAVGTAPAGTPTIGTIAILAGRDIDAGALAAGEDVALSGGGALTFGAASAGDDIDIATSGAVSLVSAISSGAGADTRAVQFDRSTAGKPTAITFADATGQLGSNIAISAASLGSATPLEGDSDDGLVIGSLTGGTQTLTADQGDIRIGSLDAGGAVDILATLGSVSGLRTGWIATSGGATIKTPGKVVLNGVGAADFAIGSVDAATVSTGTTAPDTLRLGTVTAGSIDLTAASALQIDNAAITGTATLHTTGGTAQAFSLTDAALVSHYGSAQLKAADTLHDADLTVVATGAAQLGSLGADRNIVVTAAAIDAATGDTDMAAALNGSLALKATSGRLTLGDASAATTATLIKEDADIGLAKTAADDVLTTGTVTAGGAASFRSTTSAIIGGTSAATGNLTINTHDDATIGTGTATSGAIRILAGRNVSATTLTASAEDIAVRAGGDADLGTLNAGDNLDLEAGGALTITAGSSLGSGADDRSFLFDPSLAGQDGAISSGATPAIDGAVHLAGASVSIGALSSAVGDIDVTATNGNVTRSSENPDSGSIAAQGAGSTISVLATGGSVQLGALSAGQGNLILTGAQIGLTAKAIDIQSATATNGALALTATDGDLKLGSGAAGTTATLIKQGQTGSLSVAGALTAATDVIIQSQTDAALGSIKSLGGSVAVLAQSGITGADTTGAGANLDAFEDVALSAGGDIRIGTARAGDDITIETPGALYLESATADGSANSDARTIQFDRSQIGQEGAIAFVAPSEPAGSNIIIHAASLDGPALAGDTDTGLVTGTLDSGAVDLSSAGGDIRADTINATDGDVVLTTTGGSVTGRRTGFQSASGGATISAHGQVTFDVSGTIAAGSVTAGTAVTNAGQATPDSIRLGSVSAGSVTLTAATNLQVDKATVGGATTLAVTGGTANSSVDQYGLSTIAAQAAGHSVTIDAGGAAQLGVIEAGQGQTAAEGDQIVVRADAVRIGGLHAHNGDILVEAKSRLALLGAVDTANPDATIVFRNTGTGGTLIGGANEDTGSDIALNQAELDLITGGNVVIDSMAQPVTIDKLTIASSTGTKSLRFLTTGAVEINDVIAGDGSGIVQIGGSSGADPDGLVDEAALASEIRANIGDVGTRAAILLPNGTVDLRAGRIVFGRPLIVDKFLPQDGAPPSDAAVAADAADSSSALYTSDDTSRQFLTARLLKVSYAHYALFQNTATGNGGGVVLNDMLAPSTASLALQLFSTGNATNNSFLLFGQINGFVGRSAGILPNDSLEIRAGGVTRIAQGNSRVNGCVIGSPDRGCLVVDSRPPNFTIYDQRQTQLFGIADDPLLFFNPLVGRGNEGLIVDIADAPVGIDTIECDPAKGPCAAAGPK